MLKVDSMTENRAGKSAGGGAMRNADAEDGLEFHVEVNSLLLLRSL